ncbi:hypothetical protein HOD29_07195 [archaeon]|jgi:hypothetical protein|nr:hypothetical protein [archaeon]
MKAKFIKEKDGTISFRDKNGALWDGENIAELFEMVHAYAKFHDFMEHFRSERVDDKDMYDET